MTQSGSFSSSHYLRNVSLERSSCSCSCTSRRSRSIRSSCSSRSTRRSSRRLLCRTSASPLSRSSLPCVSLLLSSSSSCSESGLLSAAASFNVLASAHSSRFARASVRPKMSSGSGKSSTHESAECSGNFGRRRSIQASRKRLPSLPKSRMPMRQTILDSVLPSCESSISISTVNKESRIRLTTKHKRKP